MEPIRAVYYCRVSTEEELQLNALADQIQEAEKCVAENGWKLVDKYIDEGKSGTTRKKRNAYNRLFDDLYKDKFDIIVVKSQDRLMRNTRDWYVFTDVLATNKKKLFFYLENRYYTPDDALITGIKAILAEEYSRDLSKKIRNAHRHRQETGKTVLITSATWGYDKVGKKVVVNEKEAEMVRLIFHLAIEGYGSRIISKKLSEKGYLSRNGNYIPEVTIRKIIRNPLFMGTAVMNRRTVDFETKKQLANPQEEWKYHQNAVPAIVSPNIWQEANRAMDSRKKKAQPAGKNAMGMNGGKYSLSGLLYCGKCQATYWRRKRPKTTGPGEYTIEWMCSEYVRRGRSKDSEVQEQYTGGCNNRKIDEEAIMCILKEQACRSFSGQREAMVKYTLAVLKEVFHRNKRLTNEKQLIDGKNKLLHKKNKLLDKLLDGIISDVDYKNKIAAIEKQLNEVAQKQIQEREMADSNKRLAQMLVYMENMDLDPVLTAKLLNQIQKIIVWDSRLEIQFIEEDREFFHFR